MRGSLLDGRYRLEESVGAGGMGEVWRARDEELGRQVAVKLFSPPGDIEAAERAELLTRFRREARAAAALSSPHIVTVFDHGTGRADDGEGEGDSEGGTEIPYLVMELLTGRAFHEVLREEGRVALDTALDWTEQICRALEVAHGAGVVHRDIKPANLMAGADGTVQVMDFGIATFLEGAESASRLTRTGHMPIGSVLYMAPEQFRMERGDGRVDLYALGCVLYELLIGRPPFVGPAAGVMYNHMNDVPLRPSRARAELGPDVDRLILDLMAKDPEDRPRDAAEALERVRGLRGAQGVRQADAASEPEPEPAPEPDSTPMPQPQPQVEAPPDSSRPRYVRSAPVPGEAPKPALRPIPRAGVRYVRSTPVPASRPDAPTDPRRRTVAIAVTVLLIFAGLFVGKNVEHYTSSSGAENPESVGSDGSDERPGRDVIAVVTSDQNYPRDSLLRKHLEEAIDPKQPPPRIVSMNVNARGAFGSVEDISDRYPRLLAVVGQTSDVRPGSAPSIPVISTCYRGNILSDAAYDRHLALQPDLDEQADQLNTYLRTTLSSKRLLVLWDNGDYRTANIVRALPDRLNRVFARNSPGHHSTLAGLQSVKTAKDARTLLDDHRPDAVVVDGATPEVSGTTARLLKDAGFTGKILVSDDHGPARCATGEDDRDAAAPPGTLRFRPVSRDVSDADCVNTSRDFCREVRELPDQPGALEELQAARAVAAALKSVKSTSSVSEARTELWEALSSGHVDGLDGAYSPNGGYSVAVRPLWLDRFEDGEWKQLGTLPSAGQS
ncbi:protein kinase [Streptomyces sp. E11-3]|uniref:protein kinase domain-containing protein n=1 Tax=Streptomyces sp. E11-3 TaxID=3110112 RepID=UPI0039800B1F